MHRRGHTRQPWAARCRLHPHAATLASAGAFRSREGVASGSTCGDGRYWRRPHEIPLPLAVVVLPGYLHVGPIKQLPVVKGRSFQSLEQSPCRDRFCGAWFQTGSTYMSRERACSSSRCSIVREAKLPSRKTLTLSLVGGVLLLRKAFGITTLVGCAQSTVCIVLHAHWMVTKMTATNGKPSYKISEEQLHDLYRCRQMTLDSCMGMCNCGGDGGGGGKTTNTRKIGAGTVVCDVVKHTAAEGYTSLARTI